MRDYSSEMLDDLKLGKRQMRDWEEPSEEEALKIDLEYEKLKKEI